MSDWSDEGAGTTVATGIGTVLGGPVGGAIAGGAMQLLGGLFGNKSAREQAARQEAIQREFAQNSIRWRVADAKAAGLHPLYALGGVGSTYSPAPIAMDGVSGAMGNMGQDLSRAAMAQMSVPERESNALQQELMRAQIRESDARTNLANSQAARLAQASNASQPLPMEQDDMEYAQAFRLAQRLYGGGAKAAGTAASVRQDSGITKVSPKEVPTTEKGRQDVASGIQPGFMRVRMDNGSEFLVPNANDAAGAMQDIDVMYMPSIVARNVREYGIIGAMRNYLGYSPHPSDTSYAIVKFLQETGSKFRIGRSPLARGRAPYR